MSMQVAQWLAERETRRSAPGSACAWLRSECLRVDSADLNRFRHAPDSDYIRGDTGGQLACEMNLQHIVEGRPHDAFQAVINILRLPEQVRLILHPFEVGDGDAARVAQ